MIGLTKYDIGLFVTYRVSCSIEGFYQNEIKINRRTLIDEGREKASY